MLVRLLDLQDFDLCTRLFSQRLREHIRNTHVIFKGYSSSYRIPNEWHTKTPIKQTIHMVTNSRYTHRLIGHPHPDIEIIRHNIT